MLVPEQKSHAGVLRLLHDFLRSRQRVRVRSNDRFQAHPKKHPRPSFRLLTAARMPAWMDRVTFSDARLIDAFPHRYSLEPALGHARCAGSQRFLHQRNGPDDALLVFAPLEAEVLEF